MKSLLMHHDISLAPLQEDLEASTWSSLRKDIIAGCTVALLTIPQVMAYALMAGLPLTCGLFGAVFATMLTALLGSSRHLIVGPTNITAILVQTATAQVIFTYFRDISGPERDMLALQIVTQLTLLVGILQILASVFGLGRLTQFVSYSVVVGYMTGTAIALAVNQFFVIAGLSMPEAPLSVVQKLAYLLTHLGESHLVTLSVGLVFLFFLLVSKRQGHSIVGAAILLSLGAGAFYVLRTYPQLDIGSTFQEVHLVGDTGQVGGMPTFMTVPFDLALLNQLFPAAMAIALLGMLEASAVGKSAATKSGQQLNVNQEVFGLGVGNFVSALVGAMPSSGSPSRTGLNYSSGAKTRFAGMFCGLFVFLFVFALGPFISFVPLAAFSALLLVTAFSLIDSRQFALCLRSHSSDAFVLVTTVLACVIFSVDVAFFIGIGLSITFYLNKAATPYLVEHLVDASGDLCGTEEPGTTRDKAIRIISVQGELFFGAADLFQNTLKALAAGDQRTKVLILRLKHARDVDATACVALLQLNRYLKESGRYLVGCSITRPVWEVLCNSGIADEIGKENLFLFDAADPQLSVRRAWKHACEMSKGECKIEPEVSKATDAVAEPQV